jgi:hypothetical protein
MPQAAPDELRNVLARALGDPSLMSTTTASR